MLLPVGFDDFGKITEKKLNYIDKSLFIKDLLDDNTTEIFVITRPRRFGKTLNLSMLHYFLAATILGKPTHGMFNHLKIAACGEAYMQHQGKYPVIAVTFKEIKETTFKAAVSGIAALFSDLYAEHHYLLDSKKLSSQYKKQFNLILNEKASHARLKSALKDLSKYLYLHHGIKPWILIDEYDTPIQASYLHDHYGEMVGVMRGLFGAALKNNPYLNKAVVTGILRVAKESLFSGVNNLEVFSVLRTDYSQYFGFTEEEVNEILLSSNLSSKAAEIKEWYNGYQIGNTVIYNPWSIASCIKRNGETEPYWINTSDNQLIKNILKQSPLDFKKEFEFLLEGKTTTQLIDEHMAFIDLKHNPGAAWSLLLMSGYLKPLRCESTDRGKLCQLAIPNREVKNLYRQIVEQWLSNGYGYAWYDAFLNALLTGDMPHFTKQLEKILLQIASYHDMAQEPEAFYQGLLLGFIASLRDRYLVKSNRESGLGRYDIMLIPKDVKELGIVLELKLKEDDETLQEAAAKALVQIDAKQYTEELRTHRIIQALKIGIGFIGKTFVLNSTLEKL
jgi:hypothetical protein